MEIVEEEEWEGIIPVEGIILVENWEGIPYNICHFHHGFTTLHRLKDEEAKQLPADNGSSKILCSPRSRDFWHGFLRYAVYFSSPFVFPYLMYAMYVVTIIFICHIKLYTSCALF